MLHLLATFAVAALLSAGQSVQDADAADRTRLADSERQVLADLLDPALMGEFGRATMVRLTIESNWKLCAATEAGAIARKSERPARLVAEAALTACLRWREALRLALDKGAYPYLNGLVSRDDMISTTELEARDTALARILRWRGASGTADVAVVPAKPRQNGPLQPRPIPLEIERTAQEAPAADEDETAIVVVGKIDRRCRVRFADRTLTEAQLAQKAREWAATGTMLRLVRPAGADYRCLSKIVWHLGESGMRRFVFVEPSDAASVVPTQR